MISARVFGCFLLILGLLTWLLSIQLDSKMTLFIACMLGLFGGAACVRIRANPETLKKKHILVTGCDSGIGLHLAQTLLTFDVVVYAGFLHVNCPASIELKMKYPKLVHCIQMDVTKDQEIQAALKYVESQLVEEKGLWAVVNNAGIQYSGDTELHTMQQIRQVMEVNYFGLINVTKTFLPLLRKYPGRIINVSSVRGLTVWPFAGPYSATKFAIEAISDAFRLELARFGIHVVIVEPSHFGGATGMLLDSARISQEFNHQWAEAKEEVKKSYGKDYLEKVQQDVMNGCKNSCNSLEPITRNLLDALASDAPKSRYFVSGTNHKYYDLFKWTARLRDWLPSSVHDAIVANQVFPNVPRPSKAVTFY